MMVKTVSMSVLAALIACGCSQKPDEEAMKTCWSPSTKQSMESLVKKALTSDIIKEMHEPKASTAQKREFLQRALAVTIDSYHVEGIDAAAGSVSCGARAAMTLTRDDGKKITASDEYFDFKIFRGESGNIYSVPNTLPIHRLVAEAAESTGNDDAAPAAASDASQ